MEKSLIKQLEKERYINSFLVCKIETMQKLLDVQEVFVDGLLRNTNHEKKKR